MNRDKARDLLDRLQSRTEERGATPAEALQAAELAERIAKRYGLNLNAQRKYKSTYTTAQKSFPAWKRVVGYAIRDRFKVEEKYRVIGGQPAAIQFTGPEHLASVAAWLFRAIEIDIEKRSYIAARADGLKGGKLYSFRLEFSLAAAWEIHRRLNPAPKAESKPGPKELRRKCQQWEADKRKRLAKLSKNELRKEQLAVIARMKGRQLGKEMPIDTNVVGGGEVRRIEQQCS